MAADVTVDQLLRNHFVLKVISERRANGSHLQDMYGMRPGANVSDRKTGDTASWDIFNHTRTLSSPRPRMANAHVANLQPMKSVTARVVRQYEKFYIPWEKLVAFRPMGKDIGTLDAGGQNYVMKQLGVQAQRMINSEEFMFSRMLYSGGFDIQYTSENKWDFAAKGTATNGFTVEYNIPAANIDTVATITGVSGTWDNAATDILGQLLALNYLAEDTTGYPVVHFWMNSKTATYLLNNTKFQAVGGSAFRVWDRLSTREMSVADAEGRRFAGVSFELRAWPQFKFHTYDQAIKVGTTDAGSSTRIIPDKRVICTPEVGGDWYGRFEGSEMVQETLQSTPHEEFGFYTWKAPTIEPPGFECHMLNNSIPLLYIPAAVYVLTVAS